MITWQDWLATIFTRKKRGSDLANMFFFGWFLVILNWKAWREENQIFTEGKTWKPREPFQKRSSCCFWFTWSVAMHCFVSSLRSVVTYASSLAYRLARFSSRFITRSLKTLKMKNVFCLISSNVQCQEKDSKNFQYADVPLSPCWRSGEPRTGSWVCVHNSSPTQSGPKVSHPAIAMLNSKKKKNLTIPCLQSISCRWI